MFEYSISKSYQTINSIFNNIMHTVHLFNKVMSLGFIFIYLFIYNLGVLSTEFSDLFSIMNFSFFLFTFLIELFARDSSSVCLFVCYDCLLIHLRHTIIDNQNNKSNNNSHHNMLLFNWCFTFTFKRKQLYLLTNGCKTYGNYMYYRR